MANADEDDMEYDALSGRTLSKPGPWQTMLDRKIAQKTAAAQNTRPPRTPRLPTSRTDLGPRLPDADYKVIFRPRTGLRISAWTDRQIAQGLQLTSGIPEEVFNVHVTVQSQPIQNLIVASTPDERCARALSSTTLVHLGATTYELQPYLKPFPGTVRGVIHGLDQGTTTEQLPHILSPTGLNAASIIDARMLGKTTSALITFEGKHVPFYVKAYGTLYRCRPYRQTVQHCSLCGELGHRRDVCPEPDKNVCVKCNAREPTPDHECTPKCLLCGQDHPTADKTCKKRFKPSPLHSKTPDRTAQVNQQHQIQQTTRRPAATTSGPARESQVSWSALFKAPPTAQTQFPLLPNTTPSQPHPDPRLQELQHENAQLRQQNAKLQQQLADMQKQMDRISIQMETILQNQNAQQPSHTPALRPESNPKLPSLADTTDARLAAFETRLEQLLVNMCEQIKTTFADISQPLTSLDTRVAAMEEEWQKQMQHKKPKKDTPPTTTSTPSHQQ